MNRHQQGHGITAGEWLVSKATNNPEGLLLLAAGAALLLRSGRSGGSSGSGRGGQQRRTSQGARSGSWPGSEQLSQAAEGAREYASEIGTMADDARQYASEIGSKVSDTAGSYAASATRYVDETTRAAAEKSGQFVSEATSTLQSTTDRVLREQPLIVAVAGLAAGAAVAAAFPRTDVERRTIGSTGERLTNFAAETAEQVKNAGLKAGERLMSSAEQRGLSGEGFKEMAHEAADAFSTAFSGGDNQSTGTGQAANSSEKPATPGGSAAEWGGRSKHASENVASPAVSSPQFPKPNSGR